MAASGGGVADAQRRRATVRASRSVLTGLST